jgi:hypothetical protein
LSNQAALDGVSIPADCDRTLWVRKLGATVCDEGGLSGLRHDRLASGSERATRPHGDEDAAGLVVAKQTNEEWPGVTSTRQPLISLGSTWPRWVSGQGLGSDMAATDPCT